MLTMDRLRELVRLSLIDPARGGAAVLALNPPSEARWLALGAAMLVGVVMAYLLPVLSGQAAAAPPPLAALGVQAGANLFAVLLASQAGRIFGGRGTFDDAVLLVAWLQALMVLVQAVQLVALLILPMLSGVILILALGLFFWLAVGFVQALHGFTRPLLVLVGTLGTLFAAAFILSLILMLLGFDPRPATDA